MTKKELSQLYYLNKEIEHQQNRLRELESTGTTITQTITGMPHVSGVADKVGKYAAEITDLKSLLELNLKKCFYELNRLNRYINGIDDTLVRQVITLRFVNGLRWNEVANCIGGGNTEDSVKKVCYRYINKT